MKHGTILRNLWQPSYNSLFVYMGTSGKYAKGLLVIESGTRPTRVDYGTHYFKDAILNDREHFPIVGYIDLEKLVKDAVINATECGYATDAS